MASVGGETYVKFGIPGVILMFFALGYFLTRLEKIGSRSPYILAAQAVLLGPLLWCVRNDFNTYVRPALWGPCLAGSSVLVSSKLKPGVGAKSAATRAAARVTGRAQDLAARFTREDDVPRRLA